MTEHEISELASKESAWIVGKDIVPSIFYQMVLNEDAFDKDDESTYRIWVENASLSDPEMEKGKLIAEPGEVAVVEILPSATLETEYPDVYVIIDGKEYAGLGILSQPLRFYMDRDHKIVIDWKHGEIYESFRVVVNRAEI